MRNWRVILLLACVALLDSCKRHHIVEQSNAPDGFPLYTVMRAASAITIDGTLDERDWENAAWTSDFISLLGKDQPKPELRTRAKFLYDDQNLYIAAEITEPDLWATDRTDNLYTENAFEMFLDPDGDGLNYWELEINPKNTAWLLLMPKPFSAGGKPDLDSTLPGLKTAVHLNGTLNNPSDRDQSWTVEVAIPFASLRQTCSNPLPPKAQSEFRINLARVEYQLETEGNDYRKIISDGDYTAWSAPGEVNLHIPEAFGHIIFSGR